MSSDEVNAAGYSHHNFSTSNTSNHMHCHEDDREAMTCSALCSLSASAPPEKQHCRQHHCDFEEDESDGSGCKAKNRVSKTCPSTLPMFLSKTYHMIDKCDPEIATWSESGDNFVVKNVEKFASAILPLYFKHSNFSSFARQLNFYGFRKLRTDPILTTEVDPCTACYVRFYHEKFQRDRPELLQDIKRATKSDQQSRDDIDALKAEMNQLRETFRATVVDYDRKLAELSYECNRRITSMNAEYDKLLALIQQALGTNVVANNASSTSMLNSLSNALNGSSHMGSSLAALNAIASGTAPITASPPTNTDLLHSLSQAAVSLQNKSNPSLNNNSTKKRSAPESSDSHGTTRIRQV